MKDTALSSTLVAALIITVTFAATFTVPGGNNDNDGTPQFLRDTTFMVFAISDAVALFAAVTSVLMFLAIHTSRFAENDFIRRLPKRLFIGLLSLFISLAAVMVAFCAATGSCIKGENSVDIDSFWLNGFLARNILYSAAVSSALGTIAVHLLA